MSDVHIAALDGRRGRIRAGHVVLCAGAIENARILLHSAGGAHPAGIGNRHDRVGRTFMDHPCVALGHVHVEGADAIANPFEQRQGTAVPELCLRDSTQITHQILNARARPLAVEPEVPAGIAALRELRATLDQRDETESETIERRVREVLQYGIGPPRAKPSANGVLNPAMRLAVHSSDLAAAALRRLARQPTLPSRCLSVIGFFEQAPNPNSRIVLGEGVDAFGLPRVAVDWRLTDLDHRTHRIAGSIFGRQIAEACGGRFEPAPWLADPDGVAPVKSTAHHLGTTRMSLRPEDGVVDTDCRVHGMTNLYVAGGSVFPTGGWAFPTFTIVALALRLADTLRRHLELDRHAVDLNVSADGRVAADPGASLPTERADSTHQPV